MRIHAITILALLISAPSFDVNAQGLMDGIVTTQIGPSFGPVKDNAFSVAVQRDGKIVAAGASFNGKDSDFAVLRYFPNGILDASFGDGGVAIFDSKLGDDKAYSVAVQPDGKIVACGSVSNGRHSVFAILRFLSDGTLDPNFARDGVATVDFGKGDSAAYSLALANDGTMVVGGYASNGHDLDFAVLRLEKDGLVDFNFGQNGKVTTGFADDNNRGTDEHGYSVLLQPDGKILLSGYSEVDGNSVFVTLRYLTTGTLDHTFGVGGSVITQLGWSDRAYTSVLQRDGKILVAGTSIENGVGQFALVRYLPNGILDPEFGDLGTVSTSIGNTLDAIYGIAVQSDGRIVAGGSSARGADMDFSVVRYLADGALDKNFGSHGIATGQFGWKYSAAYGVSLTYDGKILAAGVSSPGRDYQIAIARYQQDGRIDRSFGDGMFRQVARGTRRTPITAEIGLPQMLFRSLLPEPAP